MGRPIVDSRMFARLDRRFFTSRATIQMPQSTPDSYGAPTVTWTTVATLQAMPCYIAPGNGTEVRGQLLVQTTGQVAIQLSGYYPQITTSMRALVDGLPYDILSVDHDSQLVSTKLIARTVTT
jgi:head-tail adaptor